MVRPIAVRKTHTSSELRSLARTCSDVGQARRLLSLAAVLDGASRTEAATVGGMDRQTLRDWVHRFNDEGPDGLIALKAPGPVPKLTKAQKAKLIRLVDEGPIPAIHGVVRWRGVDLAQWVYEEFKVTVSTETVYRILRAAGFSHVSARPQAYRQDKDALEAFKKTSVTEWRRSAKSPGRRRRSRSGSRTK